tara:strand:- start:687 stop:1133 length:447 start_codon:yes stop_codon:yes gene_type:complete
MIDELQVKPWVIRKIVLPQNTDHAGVMWHGSYLSWLEEARINALLSVGLSYKQISDEGFEMPVVDLRIKYFTPLIHGDNVLLKSWVSPGKGPRWRWETRFQKDIEKTSALATVDLVLIKIDNVGNKLLRKAPANILKALVELQEGPGS